MIQKLTRHGENWALLIDQPMLDVLKLDPDTPLEITADGQTLIVSPVSDPARKARFEELLKETNHRYGTTLKRLANRV